MRGPSRLAIAPLVVAGVALGLACAREDDDVVSVTSPTAPSPQPATSDAGPPREATSPAPDVPEAGAPDAAVAPPVRPPGGTAGCGTPAAGGLHEDLTVAAAGEARSFDLSVPPAYDPWRAYPLVVVFHGARQTTGAVRASFGLHEVAGADAVLVYPRGRGGAWDLTSAPAANADVALFDALVAALSADLCLDRARVFATGMSNGAYFTNQLGCWRGAPALRAIAAHSGGGPFDDVCSGAAVPVMILHGLADGVVPPSTGEDSLRRRRRANGCADTSSTIAPAPCVSYDGCARAVAACMVPDLGHEVWASGAEAVWLFFSSQ